MSLSARKPTRRRALRRTYLVGAMLLTVLVVVVQMRFQHTEQRTAEVVAQLRFLRDELRAGAGERMQELFPEGYFFSHVLYGLTWTDVARQSPVSKDEALREARWALRRLDSADGRAPFDPTLRPAYGVFHAGWTNRLRGAVVGLAGPGAPETARLRGECQALADAFADALDRSEPFLPAYPGQAWPVDSVVAIAALRTHDRVTTPRFGALIDRWVAVAREQVDPGTGLLWHQVTPSRDPARGSSQALIQRFLPEIDSGWAGRQYHLFRQRFVTTRWGLPGVLEYPTGRSGQGDVDSGPLVLGVSASASVVTIGAARVHQDEELARPLTALGEVLGMPISLGDTKRYAFGWMPVGDAFLAWSAAAAPLEPPGGSFAPVVPWWWRLPWLALTVALLALLWSPVVRWLLRDRRDRTDARTMET